MSSWKTTAAGLAAGALYAFANGFTWRHVLVSLSFAGLGYLAKDWNIPLSGPTP